MEVKQPIEYPKNNAFLADNLSLPEPLKNDPSWEGLLFYIEYPNMSACLTITYSNYFSAMV